MPVFSVQEHFKAISKAKDHIQAVRESHTADDLAWNKVSATTYIAALHDLDAIGGEERSRLELETEVAAYEAENEMAEPQPPAAVSPGLYAIEYISNSPGATLRHTALAQLYQNGQWTHIDTDTPVLAHPEDLVLYAWPLVRSTAMRSYDSLSTAERVKALDEEYGERILEAYKVGPHDIVAAKCERQALELLVLHRGEGGLIGLELKDVILLEDRELDADQKGSADEPTVRDYLDEAVEPGYLTTWQPL